MSEYVPLPLKKRVREHFAGRCAYCQTPESLVVSTFEYEHIIPVSVGGSTSFENLCYSCPPCNRLKGAQTTFIDPVSGESTSLFHPQEQSWDDYFRWSNDATEIIGLSPTGRATISLLRLNRNQLIRVRQLWKKLGYHPPDTQ